MLKAGAEFFVQLAGESNNRILHPAVVHRFADGQFVISLEEQDILPGVGEEFIVYAEVSREFKKQSARVTAVLETEPQQLIGIETIGTPVSAESRQCYRVSTITRNLTVRFGEREGNALLDISATGFAVESPEKFPIGAVVPAAIDWQGIRYTGPACVQSISELPNGSIRYGLHCIVNSDPHNNLLQGLQKVNSDVQRSQLRRLNRAM